MWYILQIGIFGTVVYYYVTDIAPGALLGHIMLFAGSITYLCTLVLGKLFDAVFRRNRIKLRTPALSPAARLRSSQSTHHSLPIRRIRKLPLRTP